MIASEKKLWEVDALINLVSTRPNASLRVSLTVMPSTSTKTRAYVSKRAGNVELNDCEDP